MEIKKKPFYTLRKKRQARIYPEWLYAKKKRLHKNAKSSRHKKYFHD